MVVAVDDILINYELIGDKKYKKYLVVLHGWGKDLSEWIRFARHISVEKKLKVLLVDLPGFGGSTIPKKVIDTYDFSRYIRRFLKKIGVEKYLLLGHSFGGKIAIVMASKNKNIEKLVLVSPSGVTRNYFGIIIGAFARLFRIVFSWILPRGIFEKAANLIRSDDYQASGEMSLIFKKVVGQVVRKEAAKIKRETLIVWGNKDKTIPISGSKILRKMIPKSTLRVVWGAGHNLHIESERLFTEIVCEFL